MPGRKVGEEPKDDEAESGADRRREEVDDKAESGAVRRREVGAEWRREVGAGWRREVGGMAGLEARSARGRGVTPVSREGFMAVITHRN